MFPLLSNLAESPVRGLSILYVTPLRALLNNLHPRLSGYAAWIGRTVGLWHGDTTDGERRRMQAERPDILLTTPESLEAMLVSTRVDHAHLFADVRSIVVDELHAFAGDDRGWHLLAVLERAQRLAGQRIQRIGLSATVGNPSELLSWLQGATTAAHASVVESESDVAAPPDLTLDYVGSVKNAATVVASLHQGEKRLVFSDSRAQAEEMAQELRARAVTTFVSHSSLSSDERRRSEQAFAEARDCVVVATSTLELGIDVGDLDRVIQLEAPRTVASFLQRLGRAGRRSGTTRNCLFLATREETLLRAAGLLQLWGSGYVEPVVAPPSPRHITAQQLLALALQEGQFGAASWRDWWGDLVAMRDGDEVLQHLRQNGFLEEDSGMLFLGTQAERKFGRRHFMELTSVFTAEPELTVLLGRREIGTIGPVSLASELPEGEPRILLLAGRAWLVTAVDWRRRTVHVVEDTAGGRSRWHGAAPTQSYELTRATRAVLLGSDPPADISRRAVSAFARIRADRARDVDADGTVLRAGGTDQWWTFAGSRANASLAAALRRVGVAAVGNAECVTGTDLHRESLRRAGEALTAGETLLDVDTDAMTGLKFSTALPDSLAVATISERATDDGAAAAVLAEPMIVDQVG